MTVLNPVGVVGGAERVLLAGVRAVRAHLPDVAFTAILLADGPLHEAVERLGGTVEVVPLPAALAGVGETRMRGGGRARAAAGLVRTACLTGPSGLVFLRRLRAAVRRSRPHLIHSHGLKTHVLSALVRPSGVPVIWHLHDFYSERPLAGRVLARFRGGVATGVAISEAVMRDVAKTLPGLPVAVVRNAVDTDHFTPAARDGRDLDRMAGLPPAAPGTVRVGLVATYANWKGQDVFLAALARLSSAGPPVCGYVIGGPIYATAGSQFTREELEARAGRLAGRVGFVPFQPDPADVYRMLDVVVHASTRPEPFGLTVAEAMSCGRAVIVSAAGGAAELFTDGTDAVGHPPGDAAALAERIARLSADPDLRARLGANARVTAETQFALDRFGRELADVYREVCRSAPR